MSRKYNQEQYIQIVENIHNKKYDYSLTRFRSVRDEIVIICPYHGEFRQKAYAHKKGQGCRKCNMRGQFKNDTVDIFIEKSKAKFGEKYSYEKTIYENAKKKLIITCSIHGDFQQTPKRHIEAKIACGKCARDFVGDQNKESVKRILIEQFILKSRLIHLDKYDYSNVEFEKYSNNRQKVEISCPKHGSFFQSIYSHLMGNGCSKCSHRISKPQIEWLNSLNIQSSNREKRIKINGKHYFVDGFQNNTIYEFFGDYWHGNLSVFDENATHHKIKKTFGELNKITKERIDIFVRSGYNLIYIWEKDWYATRNNK